MGYTMDRGISEGELRDMKNKIEELTLGVVENIIFEMKDERVTLYFNMNYCFCEIDALLIEDLRKVGKKYGFEFDRIEIDTEFRGYYVCFYKVVGGKS